MRLLDPDKRHKIEKERETNSKMESTAYGNRSRYIVRDRYYRPVISEVMLPRGGMVKLCRCERAVYDVSFFNVPTVYFYSLLFIICTKNAYIYNIYIYIHKLFVI